MQNSRLLLVDLNYYCHREITNPEQVLEIHAASDGYACMLKEKMDVLFVKHAGVNAEYKTGGTHFRFFKSVNRFWYIPFASHRYIKQQRPDIVLVQGLVFPLQVIALKLLLGKNCKIIVQHHGERPFKGLKKWLQRIADNFVSACFFTSNGNAAEWLSQKIVQHSGKCHEVLEASTWFAPANKRQCRKQLGAGNERMFLWVGRLHPLKDPLTILKAFERYIKDEPAAMLYMIYQTEELLETIQHLLSSNGQLKAAVHLVGKRKHSDLVTWYSAADFFVSGSYKEGSGYALLEAMACGCIPVVTAIPSFKKITGNGNAGFLFEPGDENGLLNILSGLAKVDKALFSQKVKEHFSNALSFEKTAMDIFACCRKLQPE